MREIKFRAKAIESFETHIDSIEIGDWVYGYYYFDRANMTGIIVTDLLEESGGVGSGIIQCHTKVDPETVGEYTGLKDKNGKEIYEGDIVARTTKEQFTCIYQDARFIFRNILTDIYPTQEKIDKENIEVIGNIYENPELLEAK